MSFNLAGSSIIKTLYIKHVDFCLSRQDNLKFIFTSLSKYINLELLEEFTLEIIPGYVDFENSNFWMNFVLLELILMFKVFL